MFRDSLDNTVMTTREYDKLKFLGVEVSESLGNRISINSMMHTTRYVRSVMLTDIGVSLDGQSRDILFLLRSAHLNLAKVPTTLYFAGGY